ncbi:MAG: arsinothricin resistance N-acetyltransferase ArsN1 family B [Pseudomonadota bacterium]
MNPTIRLARADDGDAIARIYNPCILETTITFEEEAVTGQEMARRIADVAAQGLPWLVAEADGELLGYAYATRFRPRAAFKHSVESSVYLAPAAQGRGLGRVLYEALLPRLKAAGRHAVVASIALPHPHSVALHERLGFRQVGVLREVGFKFGRWVDLGYWQINL